MDSKVLVKERIEAGERYVRALDNARIPVAAAMWFFVPELEKWRLLVATPIVDQKGPLEAYRRLQAILDEFISDAGVAELILYDLSVVSPSDDRVRLFRGVIDTGQEIGHVQLENSVVLGTAVEGALIYRLDRKNIPARAPKRHIQETGSSESRQRKRHGQT